MELKITQTIGDTIEIEKNVMTVNIADYELGLAQMLEAEQSNTRTATGDITLTDTDTVIQMIDPGGSDRNITLPAESNDNHGFLIFNTANANENLVIKDDGGSTLATVYQGGVGWFVSNGSTWEPGGVGTNQQMNSDIEMNQYSLILPAGLLAADNTGAGMIEKVTVDTNAEGIGAPLFLASDGNYDTADADAIATMLGMVLALETGTGSNKKVLRIGKIRHDAWNWLTIGAIIYVSLTTGVLTDDISAYGEDDVVHPVGQALHADQIWFNPGLMYITHGA